MNLQLFKSAVIAESCTNH